MGAIESDLEYQYYAEPLSNINPSTIEFEYWVSIHNVFKEIYSLPVLFQEISPELASEALTLSAEKHLDSTQSEAWNKLRNAARIFAKAENYANNCSKFSLQVLNNAYQAAFFKETHEKATASAFAKLGNYASELFTAKCEAEKFPFDFEKYKASILEVIRFFHFMYDFDEHIMNEPSYLLILESLSKILTFMSSDKPASGPDSAIDPASLSRSMTFLKSTAPLTQLFVKLATSHGAQQLILYERAISRVVIISCMTLHKNLALDIEDTSMLLKAVTQSMILLEAIEPLGCFSGKVAQKVPSELSIQTLGIYANQEASALQDLALRLLLALKTRCKLPKDAPMIVAAVFERIIVKDVMESYSKSAVISSPLKKEVPSSPPVMKEEHKLEADNNKSASDAKQEGENAVPDKKEETTKSEGRKEIGIETKKVEEAKEVKLPIDGSCTSSKAEELAKKDINPEIANTVEPDHKPAETSATTSVDPSSSNAPPPSKETNTTN